MTDLVPPNNRANPAKLWDPSRFAIGSRNVAGRPWALCILNQPIENRDLLLKLSEQAVMVICADGGANRLKDLNLTYEEETKCPVACICGDLDSVRQDTLEYYRSRGTIVHHDPDQYSTDLTKCLKYVSEHLLRRNNERSGPSIDIAIFGGLGGRADQSFSLLHQLYVNKSAKTNLGIGDQYLIAPESVLFLLEKGGNSISTPVGSGFFTPNIGIIPIGRPSIISTCGLEWDVQNWATEFGSQMSTSNHIMAETVEVTTSEDVIFTLEFESTKWP